VVGFVQSAVVCGDGDVYGFVMIASGEVVSLNFRGPVKVHEGYEFNSTTNSSVL